MTAQTSKKRADSPEKEVEQWRGEMAGLQNKLVDCNARIQQLHEAKKPIVLDAQRGDKEAAAKVAEINSQIRTCEQDATDIGLAIDQAQVKLADAEASLARKEEAARLKRVCNVAEQRIELATTIEAAIGELADLCDEYVDMGSQMCAAGEWAAGDSHARKATMEIRLRTALDKGIGAYLTGGAFRGENRQHYALADEERQALSEHLLTDRGVESHAERAADERAA